MTAYAMRTRRVVLRDMGKAGLAVLVLGTAACSDGGSDGEDTTSPTTGGTPSTSAAGQTTPPSSEAGGESPTTAGGSTGPDFHRVNLGFVSAYILYRDGEAALVDTGVSSSETGIETALSEIGLGWDSVGHVIITHKHPDHQGSLPAVMARAPDAAWYAGAGDMGAITAPVEGTSVGDGDSIFGLQVINTPGHTPGHISILDPAGGILVAGDAINGSGGGVAGANPDFTEDMALANASIEKLTGFDYEIILFGHGEPVLENGSSAVSELAAGLS